MSEDQEIETIEKLEGEETDQPIANASDEVLARRMGWRPKEEYKGDPDKWVDATDFVQKSETDIRTIRRANQHMSRKIEKMESGIEQILAHQGRQLDAAREESFRHAQQTLKRRYEEAVTEGDVVKAEKVWDARETLATQQVNESKSKPVQQPDGGKQGPSPEEQEMIAEWVESNRWYSEDAYLSEIAAKQENMLAARGVPLADRLTQTTAYIKKRFPDAFETEDGDGGDEEEPKKPVQRRAAPSMVNGSRGSGGPRPKPKPGSYEALLPEYRNDCDSFVNTVAQRGVKVDEAKREWLSYANESMFQR